MRRAIVLLFTAVSVFGQDAALARLKQAMAVARYGEEHNEKNGAARIVAVHAALRNWLEPQLPKNMYSLAGEVSRLDASFSKTLTEAGLLKPDSGDRDMFDPGFDRVGVDFKMMPELPDTLFVIAGFPVPCGADHDKHPWLSVDQLKALP